MVGPWCTVSAPQRGRCGWVLIPMMLSACSAWGEPSPGAWCLYPGPAAPLPGPNPLFLLCFPLPPRHDPASHFTRRRRTWRDFLPPHPAPSRSSICTSSWLAAGWGEGGRGTVDGDRRAVQGAILPSSALAPTPCFFLGIRLPHTGPSPPFMKSHTVLSPPSLQREPRTPNPAPSTSNSVSNPALPGMATSICSACSGQDSWASPCCRASRVTSPHDSLRAKRVSSPDPGHMSAHCLGGEDSKREQPGHGLWCSLGSRGGQLFLWSEWGSPLPLGADEYASSSPGALPPAHQETLGCSADLLLMCVDSPRAASCVQAPVCTRVAMLRFGLWSCQGPLGAVFCILGRLQVARSPSSLPRDCGVPASLCHFGLKSCPGQVPPTRAGWGPHSFLILRLSPGSAHCPAMLLISLSVPLQRPLPFLLAWPALPSPAPSPYLIILQVPLLQEAFPAAPGINSCL